MKRTKLIPLVILAALFSFKASAQTFLLTDFESFTTPTTSGSVLFRNPSFSGSTNSKLEGAPNSSIVESIGIPSGNANSGLNALHVSFNFNDTNAPLWLRLTTTTSGTSALMNPTISLSPEWGMKFDIYSDTPLYLNMLVRETDSNAAIGANGGTSNGAGGGIEFVGGNPGAATGNRGKSVAANTWTTLEFKFSSDPIVSFTGNGVLTPGTDGKGVFEALGIATDPANTGTINIWVDNFNFIPEPSTVALAVLGGLGVALWRARRRAV